MLRSLKDLFDAVMPPQASEVPAQHTLQLATAVLLVEVMRADRGIGEAERTAVLGALRTRFALADDEAARLVELADRASRDATDYFAFTSRINDSYTMEQKLQVVELMWQVAYADSLLDAHENHLMRKVADLLHVPHGAYVHAKMRARAAAAPR